MSKSGPGKAHRVGVDIIQLFDMFPDEDSAHDWFEGLRWPNGERVCPRCDSTRTSPTPNGKPMPYWCSDCRSYFSVKVGTIMESSNLPLRKWVIALYLLSTNLKGVSSMKLHRDLGITQKTAWFMAQKIRECWLEDQSPLSGEVEVDETFIGGRRRNKHGNKKGEGEYGIAGKAVVVGARQRGGVVRAEHLDSTGKADIQDFVSRTVASGSKVYTDEHPSYRGMPDVEHEAVRHGVGEYVQGQAHTNGVESFWAMLKRGYMGTYHKMSFKHLHRYVKEFAGRANVRDFDTLTQMAMLTYGMIGKKLRYADLVAEEGKAA